MPLSCCKNSEVYTFNNKKIFEKRYSLQSFDVSTREIDVYTGDLYFFSTILDQKIMESDRFHFFSFGENNNTIYECTSVYNLQPRMFIIQTLCGSLVLMDPYDRIH